MNGFRILISSDHHDSARAHVALFRLHEIHAVMAPLSEESLEAALEQSHDLVLIDLYEPTPNRLMTCQWLQTRFSGPILLMTYERGEHFHIQAYQNGVDECISKPIGLELLVAKTKAWLRRARITLTHKHEKQQHGFCLNTTTRQITTPNGVSTRLSRLEFELLCLFLDHPNRILETDLIIGRIWLYSDSVNTNAEGVVKNLVYRLRRKIEPNPSEPQYIQTIPHLGYAYCCN